MKIWLFEKSWVLRGKGKGCDVRSVGCILSGFFRWLIIKLIG